MAPGDLEFGPTAVPPLVLSTENQPKTLCTLELTTEKQGIQERISEEFT